MPKSVEELAIELVWLQNTRPSRFINIKKGIVLTKAADEDVYNVYKNHIYQEYLREEEIYRRMGTDNGKAMIDQIRNTIKLLSH